MSKSSVATGNTVDTFQEYPSLSSDNSGSEVEMEGPSHPGIDGLGKIRQQFQLLQAQLNCLISSRKIRINHSPRRGKSQ